MSSRTHHAPTTGGPGVSRFDLTCGRRSRDTTIDLVRRWAQDRALSAPAMADLCLLTSAALEHGLRFRPRSLSVSLRWADPDRVRVDVAWYGLGGERSDAVTDAAPRATGEVMDSVADSWGVEAGATPHQWMVLDTSPRDDGRRPAR